jgi:hypothetical protein
MKSDFKIGDELICKRKSRPIPHNSQDWVPEIHMIKGVKYKVVHVDESDIEVIMANDWDIRDKLTSSDVEFFGFEDTRVNHWERWFLTKAELREERLKELGI